LGWALATTWPNGERRVCDELAKREVAFHAFKRKILVAHRGCLLEKLVPAFPRYVFVPFSICWDVVRQIVGVVSLVSFDNKPALVRSSIVEDLKARSINDVLIEDEVRSTSKFNYGDEVVLINLTSTFTQVGKYHHSDGTGRAVVILEWMGRSIFVNVDECDLALKVKSFKQKRRNRQRRRRVKATSAVLPSRSHAPQA
jgi:transcription antitermination factor NusG